MSDYSKSVIYKYHRDDLPEIYIGSTYDEIQRKIQHKSDCNNENSEGYNLKVYQFIRNNGGMNNWKFEVIEEFPCDNDLQLRIRERYHYDLMNPLLNSIRPYISEEEHREYHKNYKAKYREEHEEGIAKYNAKYYLEHTEEIVKLSAKYYLEHTEQIAKRKAKFYLENIEEIKTYNSQKHNCECGGK